MTVKNSIDYTGNGGDILPALQAVEVAIANRGLDRGLAHLLKLRASQINGCAYCVAMHSSDARRDGESDDRLDHLTIWRHSDKYTAAEKAALGWTEAMTTLSPDSEPSDHRDALRNHFSDEDITTLIAIIGMINLWNRVQVSNH